MTRLEEIRKRLEEHVRAGRWFWDCFDCADVAFLLTELDQLKKEVENE